MENKDKNKRIRKKLRKRKTGEKHIRMLGVEIKSNLTFSLSDTSETASRKKHLQ